MISVDVKHFHSVPNHLVSDVTYLTNYRDTRIGFELLQGKWVNFLESGKRSKNLLMKGPISVLRLVRLLCCLDHYAFMSSFFKKESQTSDWFHKCYLMDFVSDFLIASKPYKVRFIYNGKSVPVEDNSYFEVVVSFSSLKNILESYSGERSYYTIYDWASYVYVKNIWRPSTTEIIVDLDEFLRTFDLVKKIGCIVLCKGGGIWVELVGEDNNRCFVDLPCFCHHKFVDCFSFGDNYLFSGIYPFATYPYRLDFLGPVYNGRLSVCYGVMSGLSVSGFKSLSGKDIGELWV